MTSMSVGIAKLLENKGENIYCILVALQFQW